MWERDFDLLVFLSELNDPRWDEIIQFHYEFRDKILKAKGSSHNHQNWEGGYVDHITESIDIAYELLHALNKIRPVNISYSSAAIVLYFHDIEKIWKYSTGEHINKEDWYNKILPERGIKFSPEELNALKYTHGEGNDYRKDARVMNELAAICHAADNLSARLWYDQPKPVGQGVVEWDDPTGC